MKWRKAAVLVAVLGLLVLPVGCKSGLPTGPSGSAQPVTVTMVVTGVHPDVAASFEAGQEVRIMESGARVGEIVSVEATSAAVVIGDAEGVLHEARSPIARDVMLVVEGEARVSEEGYKFGGAFQHINSQTVFLTSRTRFMATVTGLEAAND